MPRFNSLWPSDTTWRQRSGSTLAQVMACCLTAPSHYLNNVDWWSVKSSDIHIRAISPEKPQPSVTEVRLTISYLKFNSNSPGANQLKSGETMLSVTIPNTLNTSKIIHIDCNDNGVTNALEWLHMAAMASQIIGNSTVHSTTFSG